MAAHATSSAAAIKCATRPMPFPATMTLRDGDRRHDVDGHSHIIFWPARRASMSQATLFDDFILYARPTPFIGMKTIRHRAARQHHMHYRQSRYARGLGDRHWRPRLLSPQQPCRRDDSPVDDDHSKPAPMLNDGTIPHCRRNARSFRATAHARRNFTAARRFFLRKYPRRCRCCYNFSKQHGAVVNTMAAR